MSRNSIVRRGIPLAACLLRAASLLAQLPQSLGPLGTGPLAITHVTVIDVERGAPLPDRTVLLERGRITAVGSGSSRVPAGTRVVDGRGRFLIPGLWDSHTHVDDPDAPGTPEHVLALYLATGVTGIRDVGSSSLDTILALREAVRRGRVVGPRITTSGKLLDGVPPVFPPDAIVVRTAEEARRAVDSLADRGVDFIKSYEMLRAESFRAVLGEAKRRGLSVMGHVPLAVDAGEASDLGMRGFEHLRNIDLACSSKADSLRTARDSVLEARAGYAGGSSAGTAAWSLGYGAGEKVRGEIHNAQRPRALDTEDRARCSALLARLARNHTWQTATLLIQTRLLSGFDTSARLSATLRYVPRANRDRWEEATQHVAALPSGQRAALRRWSAWEAALVRRMRDAGVPLLAGTDESTPYVVPGFGLHEELGALVELGGLTPAEALRAATLEPARFLHREATLGTVVPGKLADLVLLDADPLADIRNTTRVRAVIANGRLFDRAALDALLGGVERAAAEGTPARH